MLNLGSLLEKFKHLKNPREEKERLAKVLSSCAGHNITINDFVERDRVIYINTSGYIKVEIFMKKELLLESLKKEGFVIVDIR